MGKVLIKVEDVGDALEYSVVNDPKIFGAALSSMLGCMDADDAKVFDSAIISVTIGRLCEMTSEAALSVLDFMRNEVLLAFRGGDTSLS